MRRKRRIILMLILGLLLATATAWGAGQYMERQQIERQLNNRYAYSFYELLGLVEHIHVQIGKGLVSASPEQVVTNLSEVWRQAYIAQASLSQLPLTQAPIPETAKFLTQLGDFSYVLVRDAARGIPFGAQQRQLLESLYTESGYLASELHSLEREIADGRFKWSRIRATDEDVVPDKFHRIEQQMSELPVLIYDGPFSDHIGQQEPKGLTGPDIDENRAREIALEFAPTLEGIDYNAEKIAEPDGRIPAYTIRVFPEQAGQGPEYFLDISKKGGHVIWMVSIGDRQDSVVSRSDAADRAVEFLEQKDYPGMVPLYTWEQDSITTVILGHKLDDVIIYPDQIKVDITGDDGRIDGVESLMFIMNHHERDLPEPEISEEEAKQLANPAMEIESVRLALIPLETLEERFCYEIKGVMNDQTYLVYINAVNGSEEKILQLIDTPGGQLTM